MNLLMSSTRRGRMVNPMSNVTVLCSDSSCKHNSGGMVYGVCQHPDAKDQVPYAGIDRYYQSTCNRKEIK